MSTTISIHCASDARVESFHPSNNMGITIEAGSSRVTYFDLPAAIAWSLFDLMHDDESGFYFNGEDYHYIRSNPTAAADLIRRARLATTSQDALESEVF